MTKEEQDKIIALFEKYSFKGQTRTLHDSTQGSGTEERKEESKIKMVEKTTFKSMEEIEQAGLKVIEDRETLDEVNSTVFDFMQKEKINKQSVMLLLNMSESEFDKMLGVDLNNISLRTALKISQMLNVPVETLFSLGHDAWLIDYPMQLGQKYYLNMLTLETITKDEMESQIGLTGYRYYNRETKELMSEAEYKKRLYSELVKSETNKSISVQQEFQQKNPCIYSRIVNDVYEIMS